MNKKIFALLLTVILTFSLWSTAFAAPNLDFRLVNGTGFDLYEVYLSPAGASDWGEDIMTVDVLSNGEVTDISFAPRTSDAIWDLRVVDKNGGEAVWYDFDLSTISEITIGMQNGTAVASWK